MCIGIWQKNLILESAHAQRDPTPCWGNYEWFDKQIKVFVIVHRARRISKSDWFVNSFIVVVYNEILSFQLEFIVSKKRLEKLIDNNIKLFTK